MLASSLRTPAMGLASCPHGRARAVSAPVHISRGAVRAHAAAIPRSANDDVERAIAINPLAAPPPFSLTDIRNAIPEHCWNRDAVRSFGYLAKDVAIVAGLAYAAYSLNQPWLWPLYWFAQGTMFWALFVVGHDCGHQSFSSNKTLNDFVGHITHSSILVPYHSWRISHRTHHANHGHIENDESWVPMTEDDYSKCDWFTRFVRFFPVVTLLLYPFYLAKSHYDPNNELFNDNERGLIVTTNAYLLGMYAILGLCTAKLGLLTMFNLYIMPYWCFVMWLDFVTYLHHHGAEDDERVPWYRGEEWTYLRGGLSTLDHDYGIFNKIHHDIGTHVVHHIFPQIPHYHLCEATEAVKPVMGPYYREPTKSGFFPTHLVKIFLKSVKRDTYVKNEGDIVFYETDPNVLSFKAKANAQ